MCHVTTSGSTAQPKPSPEADEKPHKKADKKKARHARRWELLGCARSGHLTYRPDEQELADGLHSTTPQGQAWRCLRCGEYVIGAPRAHGPADDAPVPRRGAQIREAVVMRLLAIERFIRAIVLFAVTYGIWKFDGSRDSVQRSVNKYLPVLHDLSRRMNVDLVDAAPMRLINRALHTGHHTLVLVTLAVLGYGLVELAEGIGLWVMKRWGEYVAVVGTSVFLPLEVYELTEKFSVLKIITLLINLALVVWLVWSKRLFGLRGGTQAFERQRESASIMEITRRSHG